MKTFLITDRLRERVVTVFSADSLKTPFFKVEEKR